MSPVSHVSSFVAPSFGASPNLTLPVWWSNPLPKNYLKVENRAIVLQNRRHLFLEMHREGARGVVGKTEYSVLKILTIAMSMYQQFNWSASNTGSQFKLGSTPIHVIQGNASGLYLCMDNNSVIYQSQTGSREHCEFHIEQDKNFSEMYYRQLNESMPKWYLSVTKGGFIPCANMTRKRDRTFQRIDDVTSNISESPPFKMNKLGCCQKGCNKNANAKHLTTKLVCKNQRRKFFQLKLNELQRYYKKCIMRQNNKKKRHRVARNR